MDDIDRTVRVKITLTPGFELQFPKIIFLTLLQIFYQNIKHRDGKAELFETPHPFPSLKIYEIDLGKVQLDMFEYEEEDAIVEKTKVQRDSKHSSLVSPKSFPVFTRRMSIFEKIKAQSVRFLYQSQGPNSTIEIWFIEVEGFGDLPVSKNNGSKPSSLHLKMDSSDGETFLKLVPENLQINVNLDKLNNVI